MKTVEFMSGEKVPVLGQGTWRMGQNRATRAQEIATLKQGLDLGLTLIDTAEMYGEGLAEALIAEAIEGRRDEVFLVSKVYPHNATVAGAAAACERSLRRLRTDRLDLYLLHWRGTVPLAETMAAFMGLQAAGKIRHYGVSNLDLAAVQELWRTPGGSTIATNQLLYNLARRGIEKELLPWLRERSVPIMAYSPIEQARLTRDPKLVVFAQASNITPAQVALAWLLRHNDVIAIPKTSRLEHLRENASALNIELTSAQLTELDRLFPAASKTDSLEMR